MATTSLPTSTPATRALPTSTVVRQTYTLLGMVMTVAAAGAGLGLALGIRWSIGMWVLLMVVFIGGPFAIARIRSGGTAILATLGWGGLTGFLLSPMVATYLALPGGSGIVLNALATTAVLFFALSGYALVTRRDFSFLGGFLFVGLIVILLAIIANLFLAMPLLSLTISAAAVLVISGMILFDTSRMIHDGASNCVSITVAQFGNITVLFSHLLNLFALLSGDD
jgi:modulator of FtsH protease